MAVELVQLVYKVIRLVVSSQSSL